jgi:hypothetical protein
LALHRRGQRRQGENKSQSACSLRSSSPLRSRSIYLVSPRVSGICSLPPSEAPPANRLRTKPKLTSAAAPAPAATILPLRNSLRDSAILLPHEEIVRVVFD